MRERDYKYLQLAESFGNIFSKDPNTKVGCVVVDPMTNRVVSMGYNGFPALFDDSPELYADRQYKLSRVIHAEMNAIIHSPTSVRGCNLYVSPLAPCPECAKNIIAAGIGQVFVSLDPSRPIEQLTIDLFNQSNRKLHIYERKSHEG